MQQTKISSSQVASSSTISNQVTFQSPIIVPPTPVSVPSSMYSPAPTTTSFSAKPVLASFKDSEAQDNCSKEDETLKMLQRHYLQAILTLAPPHKLSVSEYHFHIHYTFTVVLMRIAYFVLLNYFFLSQTSSDILQRL